jgi:3-isopropylmalate/(R)-2-methylmalate dehydratase large subunit
MVVADVDLVYSHDGNRPLAMEVFKDFGGVNVFDKDKVLEIIDHAPSSPVESISNVQRKLRNFCWEQGVKLYNNGDGVCHQIVPEQGYVLPGQLIIGTDSHTCTNGALNAFSCGVGSSDTASAMITGKLWFRVPESIYINLTGDIPAGVYGKDIILYIIGQLRADGATYQAVELHGPVVHELSVDARMTMANMGIEMGAKALIMECDDKLKDWLKARTQKPYTPVFADKDAEYVKKFTFDVSKMEPQLSCPHHVDNVSPVSEVKGKPIQWAIIGTCTNGRLDDLEIAAQILKGKKVKEGVNLMVTPASRNTYIEAMKRGYIDTLIKAGAIINIPGCSSCSGGSYFGIMADGETAVTTANRNFKGRLGNANSFIYLASPATVAASALTGYIEDCRDYVR